MADYISRKELIEHLDKCRNDPLFDPDMARICFAIGIFIKNMEAADVQPVKRGEWIPQGDDMWLCSNCKENIIFSMHESDRTEKQRYCCKCGARMGGSMDG